MSARSERPNSRELVLGTVHRNASSLLKLARQYSICADDAHDAYQRGIEIFLLRADEVEPETALSWLRTVIKHEAMGIRRSRLQTVDSEGVDFDLHEASTVPSPDEQIAAFDRLAASAEAMQRLKPQELRALWLRAQGLSYEEIEQVTGWSYTKVNRCITEGRRAFIQRVRGIESGEECERWTPVLSAMADREATPQQLAEVRPHLRNCPACRATIRDFHRAPRDISAVLPIPLASLGLAVQTDSASFVDRLVVGLGAARSALTVVRDGILGVASRMPGGGEAAGAALAGGGSGLAAGGAKVAALCVSVSVAASGTYCLESTGAFPPRDAARAQVGGASSAVVAGDRLRSSERATDRDQRQANRIRLARRRSPTYDQRQGDNRRRPVDQPPKREPTPEPSISNEPAVSTQADGAFDFENGRATSSRSPGLAPSSSAAQSQPPEGSAEEGEFGGGGFEK